MAKRARLCDLARLMTRPGRLLGAIIAGGQSRRFGSDKAKALFKGQPLAAHVIAALARHVDEVVFAGREWPGFATVADVPEPGLGPLGGLAGALAHAADTGFDAVLSAPCDLPGIPDELLRNLLTQQGPAIFAGNPIIGLWPAALAPQLARHLAETEDRSMRAWATRCGAVLVGKGLTLPNINTSADLQALTRNG